MTGRAKKIKYAMAIFAIVSLVAFTRSASAECTYVCDPPAYVSLQPALDAMYSDTQVNVSTITVPGWTEEPNYYEFSPASGTATKALILYPGACLDARAYAIAAHDIAAAGYMVAIVPMPCYLALLGNQSRADAVISNHPEIQKWSIGGHSLGGVGACSYVTGGYTNSYKINGIVLWAAYPSGNMSTYPQKVVSIWGTNDGLTDSTDIDNSKPNLPADTHFIALQGANHSQFGFYGTSATDDAFIQPGDNAAVITRQQQTDWIVRYTIGFLQSLTVPPTVPDALEAIIAKDGSTWEQVSTPGFGNINNMSVVAMAEYQARVYALTRNQVQGCEVWRSNGSTGWEQVLFPGGVTNGVYGNTWINNVWARMIVFNGKLYFGFSAGLQGSFLGSTGCEVWRYDGTTWEPVISDLKDIDENGTITGISSCAVNDGSTTATITDATQAWTDNQWAGGVLQITSGTGKYRKFRIISNTSTTLTIQQNESAGTYNTSGQETEFTRCDGRTYNNPFPKYSYTLGAVAVGSSYEIGIGEDENGFGDFWNKTITAMRIFNNKLYVSTGLNYEYGGQVWYTEDGDDWYVTPSTINVLAPYNFNSFGNFHTGTAGAGYPGGNKPVSSSVTDLIVSTVSGTPVLYAGGTGTIGPVADGGLGGCARVARLTDNGWEMIVDINADANNTGSNENGFGSPSTCETNQYNFQAWSFADFSNKLVAGIVGDGTRVVYAPSGLADIKIDNSWHYSVGDGNIDPLDPSYVDPLGTSPYPNGFDGYKYSSNPADGPLYQNLAINLFPFGSNLFGGMVTQYIPEYNVPPGAESVPQDLSELKGSQIWKSPDGLSWTQVTDNGFGDTKIVNFEGFANFNNQLYVSGSKGASSTPSGLGGAKIYRQVTSYEPPTLIELASLDAQGAWRRVILSWTTASEKDNAGFNIYRSEIENGEYVKINGALIPAKGSVAQGATYKYVDWSVVKGKTYFYKLEDIDLSGIATQHGPANATAKTLYMMMLGK